MHRLSEGRSPIQATPGQQGPDADARQQGDRSAAELQLVLRLGTGCGQERCGRACAQIGGLGEGIRLRGQQRGADRAATAEQRLWLALAAEASDAAPVVRGRRGGKAEEAEAESETDALKCLHVRSLVTDLR